MTARWKRHCEGRVCWECDAQEAAYTAGVLDGADALAAQTMGALNREGVTVEMLGPQLRAISYHPDTTTLGNVVGAVLTAIYPLDSDQAAPAVTPHDSNDANASGAQRASVAADNDAVDGGAAEPERVP